MVSFHLLVHRLLSSKGPESGSVAMPNLGWWGWGGGLGGRERDKLAGEGFSILNIFYFFFLIDRHHPATWPSSEQS